MESQETQRLVGAGVSGLVQAFSACINEMFQKSAVISNDANPFGELPPHIQFAIIQASFAKGLAQSMATTAMLGKGHVNKKQVFSAGQMLLRKEFEDYLKQFEEIYGKGMGKGHGAEHGVQQLILSSGDQGT